ncbi:MAG TPA: TonB-dependent receptor [Vicinamibacterales bacterium]|nr:TonB-dependent receptor [Vicinamibacterales bacterium]
MALPFLAACSVLLTILQTAELRGTVVDSSGAAVPDATVVLLVNGTEQPVPLSDDGSFLVPGRGGVLLVRARGFAEVTHPIDASATVPIRIVLQPASFADSVVVTADRGEARLPSAASATVITAAELANSAAGALDDVLRQTPGFTLFRRASSRTANPTTQGVTLRGVSGSGASRTLVLADGVPLNDPFGSWVYWNRVPSAAIERVEVVRGAAGDLYGADALGGVIQVLTFRPTRPRLRASVEGASHSTARGSLFGGTTFGAWTATAAGEWLRTDGVRTIGPEVAGPVDVRADSDYRTGFVGVGTERTTWRAGVRFSVYDEDRGNGTPAQVNSTAWRQLAADAGGVVADGAWEARVASGSQDYYQTFSAVAAGRATERLTTKQWTPTSFVSASGQYTMPIERHTLLVGAETQRTESTVDEIRYLLQSGVNVATGPSSVGGTETNRAIFARVGIAASDQVTIAAGVRGDFWNTEPLIGTDPVKEASFVSPRVSAAYRLGDVRLQGAIYRAHRTPTLNELYRGFRVGNILTNPNSQLEPETLTGLEAGVLYSPGILSFRVTAFANTLKGAIANFTLGQQGATTIRERRNSDEIRATGAEIEADVRPHRTLSVNGQVTFTSSRFRGSVATPSLEGNRVPQVPRVQFGAGVTWAAPQLFSVSAQLRGSGNQFDNDRNSPQFELDPYGTLDLMVSRPIGQALQGFVAVENLLDKDYDTGRTPLRTVGWPRTVRAGIRVALP